MKAHTEKEINDRDNLWVERLKEMLEMQQGFNDSIKRDGKRDYLGAAAMESAEAINHHGWKWWGPNKFDLPQLQMEIVDIWHFLMSEYLENNHYALNTVQMVIAALCKEVGKKNQCVFDGINYIFDKMILLEKLKLFAAMSLVNRSDLPLFESILFDAKMTWPILYKMYIGKNALNKFRQDNGYKTGGYYKTWFTSKCNSGEEDNEYLTRILLDAPENNVYQYALEQLSIGYKKNIAYHHASEI